MDNIKNDVINRQMVIDLIKNLPSATDHPKGKWITITQDLNTPFHIICCSECLKEGTFSMNFCPNCGADMRGEIIERNN